MRKVAEENGVDVSESIRELEDRAKQVGSNLSIMFLVMALEACALSVLVSDSADCCFLLCAASQGYVLTLDSSATLASCASS